MVLASVMEFSGSLGVGARVADTIRTKVVNTKLYAGNPAMLMLGMVCAVVASSTYLTIATRIGLPVSTTHSIMGGVIGMGVASVGANGVQWVGTGGGTGKINGGVVQVFLAWIIAPGLAGCFAAILFLITKYGVMVRKNPVWKALFLVPVYFGVTAMLLVMLLIWKGGGYTVNLTNAQIPGVIVGVGAGWALIVATFLMPWLYRVVLCDDWQLRWWHIPMGPLLLRRGEAPPPPENWDGAVQDFYAGHMTKEQLDAKRAASLNTDVEAKGSDRAAAATPTNSSDSDVYVPVSETKRKSLIGPKPEGAWYTAAGLFWWLKFAIFRGVEQDVVNMQNRKDTLAADVEEIHAHAAHYDNKAEYMYSFLQIMTAATASFVHGANDISNAIGPYATIYEIWSSGTLPVKDKAQVPLWILAFGGVALVIGLWTYGYNIMRNLGNRITLHSPSRGFSMELGSAITVILATRLSKFCLPHCAPDPG
jgi:sodium-dependent phosphate transporter